MEKMVVHVGAFFRTVKCMSPESEAIQKAAMEFIRHRHALGLFVNGLMRDAAAAEDVVQEVWVRLAAEVSKGVELMNLAGWCRGVARNLIRRHWEQQQQARVIANSEVLEALMERVEMAFAEAQEGEAERGTLASRQQALERCVEALPGRIREMLRLRYEARASMEEVAGAMGQAMDAVTKALYRTRRGLLECVERKLSFEA